MILSKILSKEEWELVKRISNEYNVDPLLIIAIGWHETNWGRLGAGRYGWHLGYGYYPGSKVKEKYQGLENQLRGACWQIGRDLKLPLTHESLTEFAKTSWKPGSPELWANAVWYYYQQLENDYDTEEGKEGVIQEKYLTKEEFKQFIENLIEFLRKETLEKWK